MWDFKEGVWDSKEWVLISLIIFQGLDTFGLMYFKEGGVGL